jgi:hypothetical protein
VAGTSLIAGRDRSADAPGVRQGTPSADGGGVSGSCQFFLGRAFAIAGSDARADDRHAVAPNAPDRAARREKDRRIGSGYRCERTPGRSGRQMDAGVPVPKDTNRSDGRWKRAGWRPRREALSHDGKIKPILDLRADRKGSHEGVWHCLATAFFGLGDATFTDRTEDHPFGIGGSNGISARRNRGSGPVLSVLRECGSGHTKSAPHGRRRRPGRARWAAERQ